MYEPSSWGSFDLAVSTHIGDLSCGAAPSLVPWAAFSDRVSSCADPTSGVGGCTALRFVFVSGPSVAACEWQGKAAYLRCLESIPDGHPRPDPLHFQTLAMEGGDMCAMFFPDPWWYHACNGAQ